MGLTLVVLVVVVKLLLHLGRVGELLPVILVDPLPDVPELAPEVVLEVVGVDVEALVVLHQVLQPQQVLHVGDLLLDRQLLLRHPLLYLLPLAQVHQVDDHVREVVRHVPAAQVLYDLAEHLVRLLRQRAPLEHVAVHLLQVHLHRVVQLVQVLDADGDAIAVEHLEHLVAGEAARAVDVELAEDLLNGHLLEQVLREVEVTIVLPVLVLEARPQPLDEGGLGELGTAHLHLLLLLLHRIEYNGPAVID